ncbi:MAG: hypothetical protein GYA24_18875 [Candidatus Lokiarchaeota archaeon]|nr:hypothetical protein [Candidatus Lokiarchaeota archaeon]
MIAAILGFATIGLPANSNVPDDGPTYLFWMISAYFSSKSSGDGLQFIFAGTDPEHEALAIPFYASVGLLAVGSVLLLLIALPNSKIKMPVAWLPAVLSLAGIATYVVMASTLDLDGTHLQMFPVPIGMCAGIGAAVLSIIPLVPVRK